MDTSNLLRSATVAFSVLAVTGVMTAVALAEPGDAAQQQQPPQWQQNQQGQQGSSVAPYDSPDFTVPFNDVY